MRRRRAGPARNPSRANPGVAPGRKRGVRVKRKNAPHGVVTLSPGAKDAKAVGAMKKIGVGMIGLKAAIAAARTAREMHVPKGVALVWTSAPPATRRMIQAPEPAREVIEKRFAP